MVNAIGWSRQGGTFLLEWLTGGPMCDPMYLFQFGGSCGWSDMIHLNAYSLRCGHGMTRLNKCTAATWAVEQQLLWMASWDVILHEISCFFQERSLDRSSIALFPPSLSTGLHACPSLSLHALVSIHVAGWMSAWGTRPIFPGKTEDVPVSSISSNPKKFPFPGVRGIHSSTETWWRT